MEAVWKGCFGLYRKVEGQYEGQGKVVAQSHCEGRFVG